jgi:hypothetical protein
MKLKIAEFFIVTFYQTHDTQCIHFIYSRTLHWDYPLPIASNMQIINDMFYGVNFFENC